MDRKLMIALLMPLVQFGVHWAETKFGGSSGSDKRAAALQYVRDQFTILERFLGTIVPLDDSVILSLIDANVMGNNVSGQFQHKTEDRHYVGIAPDVEKRAADRQAADTKAAADRRAAADQTNDQNKVPSHG